MCVIERKTYLHTDGHEDIIEKVRPCPRAVGNRLCKHVDHRTIEAARIVETKPSSTTTTPPDERDGYIVTEGSKGRQRMQRDLSKRSSNSSSVRRSATISGRSTPISTPSSASSPSYMEYKPEAPSPPPAAGVLYGERTRAPYSSSKPRPSFTKDGTAIYERKLSFDSERPESSRLSKKSSFSSIAAEVDDGVQPTLSERRRRPSISIDTNTRPTTPSSATASSPGLSQLKGAFRRDSGADVKRKSSLRHRSDSDRQRRKDREAEEDRQARIERDRLASSDRRQSTRDKLARDASHERREQERRDRHRRATADALEGASKRDDDPIQRGRDAELAEKQRERERAAQLRRDDDFSKQYIDDQLRREADARMAADEEARQPRYPPIRRPQIQPQQQQQSSPRPSSASPVSARSPITSARHFSNTAMQPRVHQYQPPLPNTTTTTTTPGQSIAERGADVIAREQARAAGQSLNEALGGMSLTGEQEREAEEYQARRARERAEEGRARYGGGRRYL